MSHGWWEQPAGPRNTSSDVTTVGLDVPENIQRSWGQYSPYFPAANYVAPPRGCNITQVHLFVRHGARYPTTTNAPSYRYAVSRLASAKKFSDPRLEFLKDYEYGMPEEGLVPLGAEQSFEAGWEAFVRYGGLVGGEGRQERGIFVRASDSQRVVDSAGNWTKGFAAASRNTVVPVISAYLSEEVNSTLNSDCPAALDGTREINIWLQQFAPPIAHRLNTAAPGTKLSDEDVFSLMAMCPFESIALSGSRKRVKGKSEFCNLFSEDEWNAFEYHGDVEKYYKTGPGNALGAIQGVGYTNELLARLIEQPVRDNTTHNASLPFPLGRAIYADFSHENAMVAVFSALGLYDDVSAPDPRKIGADDRVWQANRMVPFSARMVTEILQCGGGEGRDGTYIRILVNDAVRPLARSQNPTIPPQIPITDIGFEGMVQADNMEK
ncbi:phytase [Wolfiporia cocos MD-104 SS10]|uniref:Phytase A n=1 Tax=Wolfiporia cocos (strain MD-104) TaxID=742152 RepID=A0A2H3JG89_WOLCO|nr:phytase [Wolfiporia cocos MD-104 SS10]